MSPDKLTRKTREAILSFDQPILNLTSTRA